MNVYLLDTNIISEPTKPSPNLEVVQKIAENIDYSCISAINYAEGLSGIKNLEDGKRKDSLLSYYINDVQKLYPIIPFDSFSASIYSDIVNRLKEKGKTAPKLDTMIASVAISNNLILVTRNTSDFINIAEVSNLMLENWFES